MTLHRVASFAAYTAGMAALMLGFQSTHWAGRAAAEPWACGAAPVLALAVFGGPPASRSATTAANIVPQAASACSWRHDGGSSRPPPLPRRWRPRRPRPKVRHFDESGTPHPSTPPVRAQQAGHGGESRRSAADGAPHQLRHGCEPAAASKGFSVMLTVQDWGEGRGAAAAGGDRGAGCSRLIRCRAIAHPGRGRGEIVGRCCGTGQRTSRRKMQPAA